MAESYDNVSLREVARVVGGYMVQGGRRGEIISPPGEHHSFIGSAHISVKYFLACLGSKHCFVLIAAVDARVASAAGKSNASLIYAMQV